MKNSRRPVLRGGTVCALAAALAACGGGSATIGGTVGGLRSGASVTLQVNNTDNVTISSDQGFVFPTTLADGASYNVSVLTQPVGENCVVANGAGTVDPMADNVTIVVVTCSLTSSVGGTVTGLAAGNSVSLVLSNGALLPIASNGAFAFPGILPAGSSYSVGVGTQPVQQTCAIANGSGVVSADALATVSVSCN
ncbi:MAG: hypothetical protein JWQ76_3559 [Ramlibacter sp.]|nr:hypothetical protein [Ramlibacter sp.]